MKINIRKNMGITLISLVVTVIILLILAGISIATLTGSGLFENARLAEQKSKNAQELEDATLRDHENKIGEYVDGSRENLSNITMCSPVNIFSAVLNGTGANSTIYQNTYNMSSNSFTKTPNSNTNNYLEIQDGVGLKLKKNGWYNITVKTNFSVNSASVTNMAWIKINNEKINNIIYVAATSGSEYDTNNYTVYLSKDDILDVETQFTKDCIWAAVGVTIQAMFK